MVGYALPFIVREGPVAALAITVAGVVMLVTRKDLLAVIAGMAVAAGARALGTLEHLNLAPACPDQCHSPGLGRGFSCTLSQHAPGTPQPDFGQRRS